MLVAGLARPSQPINADWQVGLGAGVAASIAFTGWIFVVRHRPKVVIDAPFSPMTPFLPINQYPVRAWRLSSFAAFVGGMVGLGTGLGNPQLDRSLAFLGLPLLVTTLAWSWSARR
jgi:hypothetical protein